MIERRPPTRSKWIDDVVREAIISGELDPGSRLNLSELATAYDVSVTPLREAFARLAVDGLVELRPHGAARVAPISLEHADDLYALRRILEPHALAAAIDTADDDDRSRWQAAHADLTADEREWTDRLRRHADFHRALVSSCPSTWMLRSLAPLHDHSRRVVAVISRWTEPHESPGLDDHSELLNLALEGRSDDAAALLDRHLGESMERLRAALTTYDQGETRQ